jgi:oligopeptidase B
VLRHELGSDPVHDPTVYREDDDTFRCYVRRTLSARFLLIQIEQSITTEYRMLDAARPSEPPRVIEPRDRGHE